jgi:hypothetical protein
VRIVTEVYEFEVHTATHAMYRDVSVRKILVADTDWWQAYKTAVAMAWRGGQQVIACLWVP